jgi:biotin-dependent carboxylase-like uncharacterized protein
VNAAVKSVLRILQAGPGVTLQDGGRHFYLRYGVTPAGSMDRLAFDTANRALGNAPGTTAIEVGLGGLEFSVEDAPLSIALAGGNFAITQDGKRLPPAVLLRLEPGSVIRVSAGEQGAWCYVALAGGLDVPPMLGSTSTHTRSGFGGIEGRGLAAGDRLAVVAPRVLPSGVLEAPWLDRPCPVIRVILGPQDDYFAAHQVQAFLDGPWTVSARGDRMAYFLEGPRLSHAQGFNIVSDGVAMGSIQVPGEGQPIVLMADRQPTGGYPKIATVIGADLGRLAQARPGSRFRFQSVSIEEAVAARRAEWARVEAGVPVTPLIRREFSSAFLLGLDLTDSMITAAPLVPGKLTSQQRLEVLFDDASFTTQREGLVLAHGRVEGRLVHAAARSATLTIAEIGELAGMFQRAQAEAAPVVLLFDGFALMDSDDLASMVALQAAFAALTTPRLAAVMGPCVGPEALLAARADFLVITEDHGFLAVGGPDLVRKVTNEILTGEEIGGAAVHAAVTGLAQSASHDVAALLWLRHLLDMLPDLDSVARADDTARAEPGLETLVPWEAAGVYDIRALLGRIADEGDFFELLPDHAPNLVTGLARFGGRTAGIVANQPAVMGGVLDASALVKAARFAARCAGLRIPLVSVIDTPGLLAGAEQERAGLLGHAAALRLTPAVTLVTRNAVGSAALLMGLGQGTAYRWPSAHNAVFGEEIPPGETRARITAALARHSDRS